MTNGATVPALILGVLACCFAATIAENARYMKYLRDKEAYRREVKRDIDYNRVFMVTATYCDKSQQARDLFENSGVPVRYVNWNRRAGDPFTYLEAAREFADTRLDIPLIYVCGRYFGDYYDLERYFKSHNREKDSIRRLVRC